MTDEERQAGVTTGSYNDPGRRASPDQSGAAPSGGVTTASRESFAEAEPVNPVTPPEPRDEELSPEPQFEETLIEEISNLANDGVAYVQAETAFQKTRATLAGKSAGMATAYLVVALVTFHIALLALAVGLVIALTPLITVWGAIVVVVGALLLLTAWLAFKAKKLADRISALFKSNDERGQT